MTESKTYEPSAYERLIALISYMAFFVPLVTKDNMKSDFVNFHMRQSINMLIANLSFTTLYGLVIFLVYSYFPDAPSQVFISLSLLWFLPLYIAWKGIANASRGQWKPLPLIGRKMIVQ